MSTSLAHECMILVDAHSLIFQVFHAIPEMTSPAGLPTNALFGFTRDMLYLRMEKKPDYLVCAFDMPGPTFRDKIFKEYKAHRPPAPVDLNTQIPLIYRLLEAMRIPVLGLSGFEADDVIATVAQSAGQRGCQVLICTNDKDCRQLITEKVRLFNLRKKAVMDRAALMEDWGITPEQVVDLQTLVGDSVDNVPGVPGIGLKTAAKLLQELGTLDNILANIDKVPGAKKQESLRDSRERIGVGRQLVRLDTNVPMEMDWEGWRVKEWDAPALLALFQEWGFRGFADLVRREGSGVRVQTSGLRSQQSQEESQKSGNRSHVPAEAVADDEVNLAVQRELFPFGANVASENGDARGEFKGRGRYELVDTAEKFEAFYMQLLEQKRFAVDLETTCIDPIRSKIVGLAFSWEGGFGYYLAIRGPAGAATLDESAVLPRLAKVLENPKIAKVNQNIKYDMLALRASGVRLAGVAGDPMLADYLLHAGERSHNMADLANRYFQYQVIPISDLIGKGKTQLCIDQVPTARVAEYSGEDADIAWRLCRYLESKLDEEGLKKLYEELEVPLIEVLAELENNGIRLDVPLLRRLSTEMANQLAAIEQEIFELAGRPFNIASPKQLRQVLFAELKLPTQRRTGISGEASTDQETLERLAALGHLLPRKIVEHRQIAKLKGTYVDALPELVNPATGRVHASFNQTVAATGRLSSSDPNLQNIPVRTEQGRQIRQAFLPAPGWLLLTADYSQIELRLLAHFCGDSQLRQAFTDERDIHAAVAAQVFGVVESEVTSDMRRMAKTVNFGVIYGMSAHGLAQRLGISRDDAGKFIDAYFAQYPRVLDYQDRLLKQCLRKRCVTTILGRRREISGIRSNSTYQQRNQPEREAINMEIQGSAADLIKMAMLNIHHRLRRDGMQSRMLLQIHDELVFELPPEEADVLPALVNKEMTTPLEKSLKLEVPLRVDLAAGPNWLDVEDIRLEAVGCQ
ncbi:MAG: DNA polymerase I [Acidobacteria bacterium]|nr:MAG: DNA polymerase I [Acidobacteriota bacterium]